MNGKKGRPKALKKPAPKVAKKMPDDAWTIKEIQESRDRSKHAKYKIAARVVDFYPSSVEDFVMLHCTNCKNEYVFYHATACICTLL